MAHWKCAVISFGKARAFFGAGVDSSVLDCFITADGSREHSEPWRESGGYGQLC